MWFFKYNIDKSIDISEKGEESEYYQEFVEYAMQGQTKTLMLGNEENSDRLYMRIIGINHDYKADGSGKAGLTFMAVNSINQAYYFEDENSTEHN